MTTSTKKNWVLALTSLASLMVALDTLVVSTALSTIRVDLGASVEQLEWTVNAYNLSFAVLLMTGAALGDRFGRRRVFAGGLALFVAASAGCAVSGGVGVLIVARAVQGAGAALVLPLAFAIVGAAFGPEERGKALGILQGITGLAVAGGPVVGGAIADGLSWQWIFWVNVPIGLVAIPLVWTRIEESFGPDPTIDLRGVALVTLAGFGVVWGLVRGNASGWDSPEVLGALASGAALAAAFVAWEVRARAPMLPMRFFRSRAFSAGNVANCLALASLFGAVFFLAQFLQTGLGYSPLGAGLRLLPWTATLFFVAPVAGALVNRVGERALTALGLVMQAGGMAWIALVAEPGMAYGSLVAPLMLAGCGISMTFPATQNAVIGAVEPSAIGKASGTFSMMRELGGVMGIAIAVAVFAGAGGYASPRAFADGFGPAIGVSAGLAVLGALAGLLIPGRAPSAAGAPGAVVAPGEPALERAGGAR